jgi:1-acyl-sn-glycerol-3-phosphate acyltransferase
MLSAEHTRWLAILVLMLIGVWLVAWLLRVRYRQFGHFTLAQFPLYLLAFVMTRIQWRATVEGSLPFGPGQGAVIISNHRGPIDPAFVTQASNRPIHWLVASEYLIHPFFGLPLRTLKCIPVNRGGRDTAALKLSMRYAAAGEMIGLFPEGRINTTDRLLLAGRPGVALIALRAGVPVVPCYIEGSPYDGTSFGFLFMRARVRVRIGQPIDLSEYQSRAKERGVLEEITKRFMVEIARLAGVENYDAIIAGSDYKTADVG